MALDNFFSDGHFHGCLVLFGSLVHQRICESSQTICVQAWCGLETLLGRTILHSGSQTPSTKARDFAGHMKYGM